MFDDARRWLSRFLTWLRSGGLNQKHATGKRGEDFAAKHLKKQGYRIVARNWRWKRWEIDIIATKDNLVIFVEVKARSRVDYGRPEEAVDQDKISFVRRAAKAFIKKNRLQHAVQRFDIIAVTFRDDSQREVRHIENAF